MKHCWNRVPPHGAKRASTYHHMARKARLPEREYIALSIRHRLSNTTRFVVNEHTATFHTRGPSPLADKGLTAGSRLCSPLGGGRHTLLDGQKRASTSWMQARSQEGEGGRVSERSAPQHCDELARATSQYPVKTPMSSFFKGRIQILARPYSAAFDKAQCCNNRTKIRQK